MASFSVGEAATAGFGIIARKPMAVLAWGLAMAVALAAPMYLLTWVIAPDLARMVAMGGPGGEAHDPQFFAKFMRFQSSMMLFQLLMWLWSTAVRAVFCSAVFRVVLEPTESRWAYLRLGPREGWLTLLFLVEYVLAYIACFVIVLLGVLAVAIVSVGAGGHGTPATVVTAIVVGLAALLLILWVAIKLSMAAPMTFAHRQFRLFESWSFTRGHVGKLVAVGLLLVVFLIGIQVLFGLLALGGVFALGGSMSWLFQPGAIQELAREPPMEIVRKLGPAITVVGTLMIVFSTIAITVFCAPWAVAYKGLREEGEALA